MPLPSQNDFLRPFLEQLTSGDVLSRAALREGLIRHFKITKKIILARYDAMAASGGVFGYHSWVMSGPADASVAHNDQR